MRLDRLLANLGYGSRREVQGLMARGQVRLDGAALRDPSAHVTPTADLPAHMTVVGQPLDPPSPLSLILHKPLGVVCSHREAGRSVYELFATLARPLTGEEGALFASGALMLEGETKPLAPAALEPLSDTTARLTITEGRYHQVRRMFAAAGNHVAALHREAIGALQLPADLAPGDWRIATPEEITAAGG